MLDHVSIPVVDIERSAAFYDAVVATLGWLRRRETPNGIPAGGRREGW